MMNVQSTQYKYPNTVQVLEHSYVRTIMEECSGAVALYKMPAACNLMQACQYYSLQEPFTFSLYFLFKLLPFPLTNPLNDLLSLDVVGSGCLFLCPLGPEGLAAIYPPLHE